MAIKSSSCKNTNTIIADDEVYYNSYNRVEYDNKYYNI